MFQLPLLLAQQAADQWSDVFFGVDEDQRFVLLIIGIACATAVIITVTGIIAGVFCTVQQRRYEMELKQDMLDRGMSAEEINTVIEATPVKDIADRWVRAKLGTKK